MQNRNTRFKPGISGNSAAQWRPGQSGNPTGKSRRRAAFEESFNDALLSVVSAYDLPATNLPARPS